MKIKAKIDRMVNSGNVKAIASVSLDGMFVVKNLKIMDGRKGLFVSMPQETFSGKDGQKKYSNLFFALTNSAKLELQETVLQAYQQQIDPNYTPKQSYEEQGILQEVQHQREYYPQPPYPEPGYCAKKYELFTVFADFAHCVRIVLSALFPFVVLPCFLLPALW